MKTREKRPIRPECRELKDRWTAEKIESLIRFMKENPGITKHTTSEFILRQHRDFMENTVNEIPEPTEPIDWTTATKIAREGNPNPVDFILDEVGHFNSPRSSTPLAKSGDQKIWTLEEFCDKFLNHNSIIRLWHKVEGGYEEVATDGSHIFEAHRVSLSKYSKNTFKYIVSILILDDDYSETVNIVI